MTRCILRLCSALQCASPKHVSSARHGHLRSLRLPKRDARFAVWSSSTAQAPASEILRYCFVTACLLRFLVVPGVAFCSLPHRCPYSSIHASLRRRSCLSRQPRKHNFQHVVNGVKSSRSSRQLSHHLHMRRDRLGHKTSDYKML
ncbi:hypothetical protein V5799_003847 [Amblyomma americanum]|uniref:Uncharacterized protein n=1 Tax=Amblyomma americanum TaxID=6943 RepID=A0AAQ4D7T1_AMBAM